MFIFVICISISIHLNVWENIKKKRNYKNKKKRSGAQRFYTTAINTVLQQKHSSFVPIVSLSRHSYKGIFDIFAASQSTQSLSAFVFFFWVLFNKNHLVRVNIISMCLCVYTIFTATLNRTFWFSIPHTCTHAHSFHILSTLHCTFSQFLTIC